MILGLHIAIACLSIVLSGLAFTHGSVKKLQAALAGIIATIVSGITVGVMQPTKIGHICISGLVFSALSIGLYAASRRKLTLQKVLVKK